MRIEVAMKKVWISDDDRGVLDRIRSHNGSESDFERMGQIAESLFRSGEIPKIRLAYFSDPKMNSAGHGRSIRQCFEKNGCCGSEILRHPNFEKYLRYFIDGPDLPERTIEGFCRIVTDDLGTSGEVMDCLRRFARKEIRDRRLDRRHAADEFLKLAHEIGYSYPDTIREAAMRAR